MNSSRSNFIDIPPPTLWMQIAALSKKSILIYWRNKSPMFKELLLPIITSLAIYANQFTVDMFLPVQILFPISLMGHVRSFMVDVVHEKSEKYKEYLKINGVSSTAYLFSLLLFGYFKCLVFTIVTCSGFLFVTGQESFLSNGTIFLLYFLSALACTHFALLVTAFFSSKQLCSDIGGFIFATLSFLFLIGIETQSEIWYYVSLFFPQNTLAYVLFSPTALPFAVEASTLILYVLLDSSVYLLLFLYLDQVLPDSFGVKRNWCFCLQNLLKKRRGARRSSSQENRALIRQNDQLEGQNSPTRNSIDVDSLTVDFSEEDSSSALYHEKFDNPDNFRRSVYLEGVSKSFGSEKAIDNLSLMIYERQVFCLLGHNGAGKTTTINLLTGILNYDAGHIYYNGKSFHKNISSIRKKLGLCNQQDILYPDLTVEEHMELMGKIRGMKGIELYAEIQSVMQRVSLTSERKKTAKTLSGGNKRKLCLGLAVLADVRIVFLDEPTSGMDPNTRRFVWDLVKELRDEGRTILLTTHHLDEADELSDRLAVMSKGKLFAVGTPEFIKKKFGVGYHLEVTPNYEKNSTSEQFQNIKPDILHIVSEFIEGAKPQDQGGAEVMRFLLPFSHQNIFPQLFEELEKLEDVKLNLKMNSLEDAFINISLQDDLLFEEGFQNESNQSIINIEPPRVVKQHIPRYDFWYQIEAMWQRKYFFTIRNYKNIILIILPIIFVILGTVLIILGLRSLENDPDTLPESPKEEIIAQRTKIIERVIFVLFLFMINFAYSLNATVYCVFPVYEREYNIAYLLRVMGCRERPYWLGTFTFDFLVLQLVNFTLVLLVLIFDVDYLRDHILFFVLMLTTYGSALITAAYFWGFVFKSSNTVFKSYTAFYIFVLYTLPSIILGLMSVINIPSYLTTIATIIAFHCCPNFAFNDFMRFCLGEEGLFLTTREQCVIWLLWLTIFYVGATLWIGQRNSRVSLQATRALQDINIEVGQGVNISEMMAETTRVEQDVDDPIKIIHLSKVYPNGFRAVKDLSFGAQKGEIFGLLGPNGAGKSTTFNIATAMMPRSGGNIKLKGQSIDEKLDEIFTDTGVCPQFDALWEDLRVDEHLYLYAKIKGVLRYDQSEFIEYLLNAVKLKEHRRKRAKELSGGSRRKLCTAISLLGSPYLKFLDEPSTGVDPMAKRFIWSSIRKFAANRGGSVVLTTHSMEEAEALCHRIGILVNGGFVCIGPLQYLKDKYGSGYKITVSRSPNIEDASGYLTEIFPDAIKIEDSSNSMETYQTTSQAIKFSKALKSLEDLKRGKIIKDFSIYNTTLEQVFINFSRQQLEPSTSTLVHTGWN